MDELLLQNLWPTVLRMTRKASRVEAAVAYFSSDSNIKFHAGDLLIVNASNAAIKNGETSARQLARLHRLGVSLYSRDYLHAKVILADQQAVIGSANASVSSTRLDEAAVATDNPVVVSQARSFIHQLAQHSDPLGPQEIKRLCAIKVVRRGGIGGGPGKPNPPIKASGKSVWIVSVSAADPDRYKAEEIAKEQAARGIRRKFPGAVPTWVRCTNNCRVRREARGGDQFIVLVARKPGQRPYVIHPPSSVLRREDRAKCTMFYYDPNLSRPMCDLRWSVFKSLCKKAGVRRAIGPYAERELPMSEALELIRRWPRDRAKKK